MRLKMLSPRETVRIALLQDENCGFMSKKEVDVVIKALDTVIDWEDAPAQTPFFQPPYIPNDTGHWPYGPPWVVTSDGNTDSNSTNAMPNDVTLT